MAIISAVSIALALFVGARALLVREQRTTAARLAQIAGTADGAAASPGVRERVLHPLAGGVGALSAALLPARIGQHVAARLAAAGQPMTPGSFLALLIVAPLALGALAMLLVARGGGGGALLVPGFAAFGLAAPLVWLGGRVTRRQRRLNRELPDVLDLVVVSVEAGLGLEAALARITERGGGPLVEELRRVLADMNLGSGRRRALQSLAARTGVPAIGALVSAILQAEQTGMGIAAVLRAQADHLRTLRRQRAEEAAMKAPLKMLFPLVFFIFPALFVVVLGPAMIGILRTMDGGR